MRNITDTLQSSQLLVNALATYEHRPANVRDQVNQFTLPPETVLIRRMHGIVGIVLWQLRAGADWGAIAAEYLHGAPPATPLGEAEAEFFGGAGRGDLRG